MAHNSLSPAFVKINYTSAYGSHVMTVPSVPIDLVAAGGDPVSFDLRGGALNVGVGGAVEDFVNLLAPLFPTSTTFVDFTAFRQPDPDDPPTPIFSAALNIAGTEAAGGWSKAVQGTLTFRADDFTLFKIVLLDCASGDSFDKIVVVTPGGDLEALRDYVVDPVTWIASRGGGRPDVFLQWSFTLNEKLRRAYGMN